MKHNSMLAVDFQLTMGLIPESVLIVCCNTTAAESKNKCGFWGETENFGRLQAVITVYRTQ